MLIGAATGLLNLRQQILTAQDDLAEAEAQVAAQKQVNADLSDAVENAMIPTGRPTSPAASWAGRAGRVYLPFPSMKIL